MPQNTLVRTLNLNVNTTYTKQSKKTNTIKTIDNEKIKYSTGDSHKYIRLSLLAYCYEKLVKENKLLVCWIKKQDKTQPCDPHFILAIFVKAKLATYDVPDGRKRAIGIISTGHNSRQSVSAAV